MVVRSPMRQVSIVARLAAAFGGLLAVFIVFGGLMIFAAKAIHGDLEEIALVAQPMRAASYEMEINAIGAGLGVVEYLHRPDPEYRARFEKDKADFARFLAQYRDVAATAERLALADTLADVHREYSDLGETLMALRDQQTVRRREFAEIAEQFDAIEDEAPTNALLTLESSKGAHLLFALATDMAEIFLFLSDNKQEAKAAPSSGGNERMAWLEGETAKVHNLLGQISDLQRTPAQAQWFARLSGLFEGALALAQETMAADATIERELVRFVGLRNRIDDILDDEIQVFAREDLAAANAAAEAKVHLTYWLLSAIGVLGLLIVGAATLYLSRTIIGPIRQLSDAAWNIAAGHLSSRANLARGGGEIRELGRAFDDMAEALETALNSLNRSNADLATIVAERTSELSTTNRQLEDELALRDERERALSLAKEAAEIASRGKTVFLANMSHELRTPLNAIIGFTEMMRMGLLGPIGNEKYDDYIKDIHESARHLLKLINDILDISKVETGNAKLREEWIEIERLADTCAEMVGGRGRDNALLVSVAVAPGLPRLWADELRLKQVLINLLDNAVKFTPRGGEITLGAAIGATGDLEISVRDNGIGIAPKDIGTVMTVFGQADSGLDRSYEGAGLGLPLSKSFIELHGGTLTLDSALGEGTRVTVTLPGTRLDLAGQAVAS